MRWVGWLMAATLIVTGGTAIAGPDEGGGSCDGCEVSQTASDEPVTNVQITMTDTDGARQLKLALSGPWNQVPEATRTRLLQKLAEMLPEKSLKSVLKQLVSGSRDIRVVVATATPKVRAVPAVRIRPAAGGGVGGGAGGTVRIETDGDIEVAGTKSESDGSVAIRLGGGATPGGVIRIMSEDDLEKLPPEVRKQIEEWKANGTIPPKVLKDVPGLPFEVQVAPIETKVEIRVEGDDAMAKWSPEVMKRVLEALEGQLSDEALAGLRKAMMSGHDGRVVIARRMEPGQPGPRGMRGGGGRNRFGGEDGHGPRSFHGGRGGQPGHGGRGMRGGEPGHDGGGPLLRAMEELTREIRGLRADLRNMHRPPQGPQREMRGNFRLQGLEPGRFRVMVRPGAGGKAEGCEGNCGGRRGEARRKSCDDCGEECRGDCEDDDDRGECEDRDDDGDDDDRCGCEGVMMPRMPNGLRILLGDDGRMLRGRVPGSEGEDVEHIRLLLKKRMGERVEEVEKAEEMEEEIEELEAELEKELTVIREDLKRIMKEIESLRSK